MKRFAKIILGAACAALGLIAVLLIGVNIYLQSTAVQNRIRAATEEVLGAPVEVRRSTFTPWRGLNLSGLSIVDPSDPKRNLVEAGTFSVQFELLPLLGQRFVIREVTLRNPKYQIRQTPDGLWLFNPRTLAKAKQSAEVKPADATPLANETAAVPPGRSYRVELRKITVRDGSAIVRNRKGRVVARFDGIKSDAILTGTGAIEGDMWIAEMAIFETLFPRKLRAHFVADRQNLTVTDIKAALAGGRVRSQFSLTTKPGDRPRFDLRTQLEEIQLKRLVEERRGDAAGTAGVLEGKLVLKGDPRYTKAATGFGEFNLREARLEPVELIQQLGLLLRIDELQMLELERANLKFDVKSAQAWVQELVLKSKNLILTGAGPVEFDGDLNLDARLLINDKIQRRIGSLRENFTACEDAGYKQIAFAVTGKMDRPKTDLFDKLIGMKIGKDLRGLIQGFLGTCPKDKEGQGKASSPKSQPVEKPNPSPTPSADAAAGPAVSIR